MVQAFTFFKTPIVRAFRVRALTTAVSPCIRMHQENTGVRRCHISFDYAMDKVYFRQECDDYFSISFLLNDVDIPVKRVFNFRRKLNDSADVLLNRVNLKLNSIIQTKLAKKLKKLKAKNPELTEVESFESHSALLYNNTPVEGDFPCSKIFDSECNGLFHLEILSKPFEVVVNAPDVTIALSKVLATNLLVYPIKIEGHFFDKNLSTFKWYRSVNRPKCNHVTKWQECAQSLYYNMKPEDEGHMLKFAFTPRNKTATGLTCVAECSDHVGKGVYYPFESRHKFTQMRLPKDGIRTVSYNILADMYAQSKEAKTSLFDYCEIEALKIDYRRVVILKELLGYNADVICLQEVDTKVFENDLKILEEDGFQGEFSQKITVNEGLACFFNTFKFALLQSHTFKLGEDIAENPLFINIWNKLAANEKSVERIKGRNTVMQILVLESLVQKNQILIVGNVHLYFAPDADHIRLLQSVLGLIQVQDIMKQMSSTNPDKNISLILCGDFNSVPECGIYELFTKGSVSSSHQDWTSNEDEAIKDFSFSHQLKIKSACGTPKYTNFTPTFKECLDYIFYQTDSLMVQNVVPFPTEEELSKDEAIPSYYFPSDHVALVADLKWNIKEN